MSRGKSSTSGTSAIGSTRLGGRRSAARSGLTCGAVVRCSWQPTQPIVSPGCRIDEAVHPLDRDVVLVQGHEEQRLQGRQLHVGRAVRLDRHGAQDLGQRERAADRQRLHAAGEIDRLGHLLQDQQLLDLAALHARHVAAA